MVDKAQKRQVVVECFIMTTAVFIFIGVFIPAMYAIHALREHYPQTIGIVGALTLCVLSCIVALLSALYSGAKIERRLLNL